MLDLLFGDSKIILGDIMEKLVFAVGDIARMKKNHPCGSNEWQIIRIGADIKIKCLNCGRSIMLPRIEFNKKLKKIEKQ